MTKITLLSSSYFGTVQTYSHIINSDEIVIEQHDHYTRQTYRNRTTIMAANGSMNLVIPIVKPTGKTKTKDVVISYDTNWQKNHWRSMISAYNNSPFFEYYKDELFPIYHKHWKYLIDFNNKTMESVFDMIEISISVNYSEKYIDAVQEGYTDLRNITHPKNDFRKFDPDFSPVTYRQVFSETMEFVPNLSIIDLIFNKGPEATNILCT